jgi:AraC-like DNA-binding protein
VALPAGHPQATVIQQLIRTIDACLAAGPQVAMRLGLDDQLQRTVASLLQPELLSEEPDDLLRMSDLEARSHYSRRALQYAFQERLGCSPKQWIREQRLALALEQLQADGNRPTIRAVALACGYLDADHFRTHFKRRFGMTPSQARRR